MTPTDSSSTNLGAVSRNNSSTIPQFQITKVLLEDAIQSLQKNDTNNALTRLNLADQQLGALINQSKQISIVNKTIATKFLKYENSTYGIRMQYPSDWSVEGASNSSVLAMFFPQGNNAYVPTSNSSVVAMFSPQGNNANKVKVLMSIENLSTSLTPDVYLRDVMRWHGGNPKDFPDINFTFYTASNVVLASHPGFLLNGTFKDPTSGVFEEFGNIGTIIGTEAYSLQYYSSEQTYPVFRTIYNKMIKSFEVTFPTYENSTYRIRK